MKTGNWAMWLCFSVGVCMSCTSEETPVENGNNRRLYLTGNYGISSASRSYWEETDKNSSGLAFYWENSVSGEEDLCAMICDGTKMLQFHNDWGSRYYSMAQVFTTSNPLVSQISLLDKEYDEENLIKPGDEIHSYVPVHGSENIFASHTGAVTTMIIPRVFKTTEMNSTRHLSPYLFMVGKGVVNEKNEILTSRIDYKVLPAILRLKMTNTDDNDSFTPQLVRLYGDMAATASIKLDPSGSTSGDKTTELIIYSYGTNFDLEMEGVSLAPGQTANSYLMSFPTSFKGKRMLVEFHGLYNDKKVVRTAYINAEELIGEFKSNYCYTFNLNMGKSDFEVESVGCSPWTGDDENVTTKPKPDGNL